jgi:hypothetical protein
MPISSGTKFNTTDGSWEEFEKDSKHKARNHLGKNPPKMIPIDESKMSPTQQRRAKKENRRRAYANRILDSAEIPHGVPEDEGERLETLARYKYNEYNVATDTVPFYRPYISRKRYNEICKYLIDHYLDLALDTLYFETKEHVMLSHIIEQDNFELEPNEWRAFLIRCQEENKYFRQDTILSAMY